MPCFSKAEMIFAFGTQKSPCRPSAEPIVQKQLQMLADLLQKRQDKELFEPVAHLLPQAVS